MALRCSLESTTLVTLLTNLLLDRIKETPRAKIVNLSSSAQGYAGKFEFDNLNSERSYSPMAAYCTSKLANVLFTRSLAKCLEGTGITTNAVDPGVIKTVLQQHLTFPMVSLMSLNYYSRGVALSAPYLPYGESHELKLLFSWSGFV